MKRKSNSKNRPSEFVKLFANILNYGLANHTHKRIIRVMNDKAIMQNIKTREVNYEKCNSKINHCKNSRENQSNALQRDWTNQKFVSIRNDIIGKNKQRNACENPSMANSINAVGWIGGDTSRPFTTLFGGCLVFPCNIWFSSFDCSSNIQQG